MTFNASVTFSVEAIRAGVLIVAEHELAGLSQFCNDRGISRVAIHIDHPRSKMPHTPQCKLLTTLAIEQQAQQA
jgi:hypothetical protein